MITHTRYVLAVPDLPRSARYYQEVLGFEVYEIEDPGWCFARLGSCMLMLGECPDALPPGELGDHSYFGYWEVPDARAYHAQIVARGAEVIRPPRDEPWGSCEFPLRTIDGHRIMIGSRLAGQ